MFGIKFTKFFWKKLLVKALAYGGWPPTQRAAVMASVGFARPAAKQAQAQRTVAMRIAKQRKVAMRCVANTLFVRRKVL
jgi:hypothetical protein